MSDIYNDIELNKNLNNVELYNLLIESYTQTKVDFFMYHEFKYIHLDTKEKPKRKNQKMFRMDLIDRYKKCIITDCHEIVCEACHIINFEECKDDDKYNVNNGLLLRSDIHKLFDNGYLKINPYTLTVEISSTKNAESSEKKLNEDLVKEYEQYNGKKINININSIPYLKNIY